MGSMATGWEPAEGRVVSGAVGVPWHNVNVEERLYAEKTSPGVFQFVRAVKIGSRCVV
jgi:hypothetical protein